jgi:hypothetical protein
LVSSSGSWHDVYEQIHLPGKQKIKNMKRTTYYITLLAALFIVLPSCNKFLDVLPKGVVIPTTLDDYQALLSAPLEIVRTSNNQAFLTDEIVLPDAYRAAANSYPGKSAVRAYDFENELYDVNEDDPDWTIAYRTLYVCNTVLKGLETNHENDPGRKNRIKGEALVHRAFTYLTLANEYGNHYNTSTAATDLAVPMPLKPDINALLSRSTVKEVYEQVETDLLEAIDLLPEKSVFTFRPNKASAFGVLSRMYLYMGNWQKAYENADKAFALSNYIYDYNTFTWSNPANKALSVLTGYPSAAVDKKDRVLNKYQRMAGGYNFVFLLSKEQSDLFEDGDLRKEFATSSKDWYGTELPFLGILETKAAYDYDRTGITTSELLLIRAEAQARLENKEGAMEDLNTLRKKRFETTAYMDLTASTPAEALDLVLNERRIELAFTGLRLSDIKRLNLEGRNISITHGDKTLLPGDPRMVLPIPAKVISLNGNIIQNPR